MNNLNKKCKLCGKPLKPTQFARKKEEGQPTAKNDEVLVCRNFGDCSEAEKEI